MRHPGYGKAVGFLLLAHGACGLLGAGCARSAGTSPGGNAGSESHVESGRGGQSSAASGQGGGGAQASAGTRGPAGAGGSAGNAADGGSDTDAGSAMTDSGGRNAAMPGVALAFPGAQGFGKNATGARAGAVYHVTNLNDAGAGSFREAVSVEGRFVVFDVAGYIQLATAVSVKSNITIAGQTAPGGGIGFRGGEISFANSSNIIMRHVRIRPGSDTASTDDDALSLYRAQNVMIDHASFEFGPWNNLDGVSDDWQNHPVTNITVQDSLIADPTGQQFGAHTECVSGQWAWYRNIFVNSHNRNPLAKMNTVFVNNLLYNNAAGYTTHTSTTFKHDIVNNYFVFGPASSGTDNTWYQIDKNQSMYYTGNLKDTNLNGALDGEMTTPSWYQGPGTILMQPWSDQTTTIPALDGVSAARAAMSRAGALPRDPLDLLIVSQVLTLGAGSKGFGVGSVGPDGALYTSQAQTGLDNNGYGSIATGTRAEDSDDDGMSDAWELANGSNPHADDAMTQADGGYTRLEQYVNWLAEPHATCSAGADVAVDLSAYTSGFGPVAPSFSLMGAHNGSVTLDPDKHTAHFQPEPGFHGLGSFDFAVQGSDGSAETTRVVVLIEA